LTTQRFVFLLFRFSKYTVQTKLKLLVQVVEAQSISADSAKQILSFLKSETIIFEKTLFDFNIDKYNIFDYKMFFKLCFFFILADIQPSFDVHDWKRDELEPSLAGLLPLSSALIVALNSEKEDGSVRGIETEQARLLLSSLRKASATVLRDTLADESDFLYSDDVLALSMRRWRRSDYVAAPFRSGQTRIDNLASAVESSESLSNSNEIAASLLTSNIDVYSGNGRIVSFSKLASLTFFDENMEIKQIENENSFDLSLVIDEELIVNNNDDEIERRIECVSWNGIEWQSNKCQTISSSNAIVQCKCQTNGDYVARYQPILLPPGDTPLRERAAQLKDQGFADNWLWLLLLLLLLLCITLCIVGCLVLYHRKDENNDDANTLQPYLDKAAGMGSLAAIGAMDDVSASSELERRDYPLPIGVYVVPERTESSDLRREDFSWALSGESAESLSSESELGHDMTYTEGRLAKLAGGNAGDTTTTRDAFTTEYDLDQVQIEKNTNETMELTKNSPKSTNTEALRK